MINESISFTVKELLNESVRYNKDKYKYLNDLASKATDDARGSTSIKHVIAAHAHMRAAEYASDINTVKGHIVYAQDHLNKIK